MNKEIKTYTYLDMEVYASRKVYAWLLIKELSEERGIKVPKLNALEIRIPEAAK